MSHKVSELSSDQRVVLEALIGRSLSEDESLVVRPCRVLKAAPKGDARAHAARDYAAHLDLLAERAKNVSDQDLDAAIEEASDYARHASE